MRRFYLVLALSLLGGGLLFWLMQQHRGFVLISVGHYVLELSIWTALALLVAIALLWRWARRLLGWLGRSGRFWRIGAERKSARSRSRTAAGLLELMEGRWREAAKSLQRSAGRSDMALINYLAAANAAFEEGDLDKARKFLARARELSPDRLLAIRLLEGRMLLREHRFREALDVFGEVRRRNPDHPQCLRLMVAASRELGDWGAVAALMPDLKRLKVLSAKDLAGLELQVCRHRLQTLENGAGGESSTSKDLDRLRLLWRSMPETVRKDAGVLAIYATQLQRLGEAGVAESELRRRINREWDDHLVAMYGRLTGADSSRQLVVAEAWLRDRDSDPVLLLTLGRLCLRNRLWGKARDYLESALKLRPCPEAYAELGALMAQLGDHEKSCRYYQQGLQQGLSQNAVTTATDPVEA